MIVVSALILLFCYVIIFSVIDLRKKRTVCEYPPISFVIPCYNDADTVAETVRSIYYAYRDQTFEVIVINDSSEDHTSQELQNLRYKYKIQMVDNPINLGKARSLNNCIDTTKYGMILFLDADVTVNKKALYDVVARFENNTRLGAVSCPYTPKNKGFLPLMQKIEYVMKTLVQGSYNIFSAMSLWGGFLAVRKEALIEAGGFSENAIVEDVDLAFKLNQKGWKVEQSFQPVRTYVPDDLKTWFQQKKRWVSGSLQCLIKYRNIWIKNPVQVVMIIVYGSFIISYVSSLIIGLAALPDFIASSGLTNKSYNSMTTMGYTTVDVAGKIFIACISKLIFSFFSIPYVLPLIQKPEHLYKLLYVIPFTVIYYPALFVVSIAGIILCLVKYRTLEKGTRAW